MRGEEDQDTERRSGVAEVSDLDLDLWSDGDRAGDSLSSRPSWSPTLAVGDPAVRRATEDSQRERERERERERKREKERER